MTEPGTSPGRVASGPQELPSIRQRRPLLFWTLIIAVLAMLIPLIAGMVQVLL